MFGNWNKVGQPNETEGNLVAAGVVLGRDQHQARTAGCRLSALRLAECTQDAEDCDVRGQDAEADGGDHGNTEDERH